MTAPIWEAPAGCHCDVGRGLWLSGQVLTHESGGRPAALVAEIGWNFHALPGMAGRCRETQPLGQKGQKGRKGAQHHDNDPLSDLSDLSGSGAPEKSNGLTCHRWMARPSVFVVTSFSQPARTKPSSRVRVCSASSR